MTTIPTTLVAFCREESLLAIDAASHGVSVQLSTKQVLPVATSLEPSCH